MLRLQKLYNPNSRTLLKNIPRRNFSSDFRYFFEVAERYMPRRSFTYTLIGLNCGLFGIFQITKLMGMYEEMKFLDHFSMSAKNFNYGRYHTLLTCHLVDNNVVDLWVNSILLYYFGREMERAFGNYFMCRLLLLTGIVASLVIWVKMLGGMRDITYMGTYGYLRTFMYYLILKYPYNDIIFFTGAPRIPFFVTGIILLVFDIFRRDFACLGGFATAFVANFFI